MTGSAQISLWVRADDVTYDAVVSWSAASGATSADLTLTSEAIGAISASGRDLFDALQQLRRELERSGVYPLCCGARTDCYPSGMSRDMGLGAKVYVLSLGRQGRREDLVGLFDAADKATVGSVDDQDRFFSEWLASLR
jgi:hypothetical protein